MYRLLNYFSLHPWLSLALITLISLGAATQIRLLEIRISAQEMLVMDDDDRRFYDEVRVNFGDDQVGLLLLQSEHLLDPEKLDVLSSVISGLQTQPYLERVESLFSVPWVRTVDGYLSSDPYLKQIPKTPEEAAKVLDSAYQNPFLRNLLISADKRMMAVALVFKDYPPGISDDDVVKAMDQATENLGQVYERVFSVGYPQIRSEISDRLDEEQGRLFPLAVLALLIALFTLLRQVLDILLPLVTAAISILWTLAFMGLAGIPLNVVTSIVPILLITVGSTEDIHLLSEFRHEQRSGLSKEDSLKMMAKRMGNIVLLTFGTTFVGFLSVGFSGIQVLWQFGITSSIGLLLNFIATIIMIPAVLSLGGNWQSRQKPGTAQHHSRKGSERYWHWLHRHKKTIFISFAAICATAGYGFQHIQINHNPIDSLGDQSEAKSRIIEVNQDLAGLETFSIIVESGIEDTFLKIRYVEELVKLQKYIDQQGWSKSTTSFADYLALLNGAFQELDKPLMPQTDDIVTELMIFLDHDKVKGYVTEDYSKARILVRHSISDTAALKNMVKSLQQFIDNNLDKGLEARITGDSVLTLSATDAMISGQLQSIAVLLVFIVVLIGVMFTELKVGLLAAIPNMFPLLVLFGFMGYMGIPLNIGTTMAAAIAIGIAVDDTLHFMLRYNQELKHVKSHDSAMRNTIHAESLPMIATSVALAAGFLVFSFSTFEPIRQFGMLSALMMGSALAADFIITPLIISSLRLVTIWDLLSLSLRRQVLAKSPLFKGMRSWQIRQFILSGTVVDFKQGDHVFRLGDTSSALFLLLTGSVEVRLPAVDGAAPSSLEVFSPGDVFGDAALFANIPRKTDAVALTDSSVLLLTKEGFEANIKHRPRLSAHIFHNLTTDISRRMIKLVNKQQVARIKQARSQDEHKD